MNAFHSLRHQMLIVCVLALVMTLIGADIHAAGNENSTAQKISHPVSGSRYIYYPATAVPYFNYQNTGAYAARPMVIPPTLPIITQPEYIYMEVPQIPNVRAPLPTIERQAQSGKPAGK